MASTPKKDIKFYIDGEYVDFDLNQNKSSLNTALGKMF